ncbi:MAG: 4-(cytidine 5'-diphospho)-2-C-methyl-D-erythritol kinase, partial [Actinomycetota bacterium]|nr:4-(cytidine 5'-diphospho)-2-C-methyl-D-erythritol kinase [Actinomycetota bacterium]
HQDVRLARAPQSRAALDAALAAGAWCGWLSGSGPSIVALCDPADATRVAAALPAGGVVKRLTIADDGATARSA